MICVFYGTHNIYMKWQCMIIKMDSNNTEVHGTDMIEGSIDTM